MVQQVFLQIEVFPCPESTSLGYGQKTTKIDNVTDYYNQTGHNYYLKCFITIPKFKP